MRQLLIQCVCDPHHFLAKGARITEDVETHVVAIDGSAEYEIEMCPECNGTFLEPLKRLMGLTNNARKNGKKGRPTEIPAIVDFAQLTQGSTNGEPASAIPAPALAVPDPSSSPAPHGAKVPTVVAPPTAIKVERERKSYPCILCPPGSIDISPSYWKLETHLLREHSLKLKGLLGTKCFVCGRECDTTAGMTGHCKLHFNEGVWYSTIPEAFVYVRDVMGDPQGLCAERTKAILDGRTPASSAGLETPPAIANGPRFPCPLCPVGTGFNERREIEEHLKGVHNTTTQEVIGYTCHVDGLELGSVRQLQGHFVGMHSRIFPSLLSTMIFARDNGDRLGTYAAALARLMKKGMVTGVNINDDARHVQGELPEA